MPTEEQTYREAIQSQLTRIETKADERGERHERMLAYTNGKVRKIIIALVLLGGIVIGQSSTNIHELITLFTHLGV